MIYFGGIMGNLLAFDTKSDKLVWEFQSDGRKNDPLKLLGPDGKWAKTAFTPMFNDFQDGYISMYKRFTIGWVLSSPVVNKGEIYFGSTDGSLYALW